MKPVDSHETTRPTQLSLPSDEREAQGPTPRTEDLLESEAAHTERSAAPQALGALAAPATHRSSLSPLPAEAPRRSIFDSSSSDDEVPGSAREQLNPQLEAEVQSLAQTHDPGVQASGWQRNFGGAERPSDYAVEFWRAVVRSRGGLGSRSLKQQLSELGKERAAIARRLHHAYARDFGLEASQQLATRIDEKYLALGGTAAFIDKCRRPAGLAEWGDLVREQPSPLKNLPSNWQIFGVLPDGAHVPLTKIIWDGNLAGDSGPSFVPFWHHGTATPPVEQHMERLYRAALVVPPHENDRLRLIATNVGILHWWIAHTCPFKRGSAAVADMLAATLFEHHKLQWPGWAPGISADVQALCMPDQNAFAAGYAGLMRSQVG